MPLRQPPRERRQRGQARVIGLVERADSLPGGAREELLEAALEIRVGVGAVPVRPRLRPLVPRPAHLLRGSVGPAHRHPQDAAGRPFGEERRIAERVHGGRGARPVHPGRDDRHPGVLRREGVARHGHDREVEIRRRHIVLVPRESRATVAERVVEAAVRQSVDVLLRGRFGLADRVGEIEERVDLLFARRAFPIQQSLPHPRPRRVAEIVIVVFGRRQQDRAVAVIEVIDIVREPAQAFGGPEEGAQVPARPDPALRPGGREREEGAGVEEPGAQIGRRRADRKQVPVVEAHAEPVVIEVDEILVGHDLHVLALLERVTEAEAVEVHHVQHGRGPGEQVAGRLQWPFPAIPENNCQREERLGEVGQREVRHVRQRVGPESRARHPGRGLQILRGLRVARPFQVPTGLRFRIVFRRAPMRGDRIPGRRRGGWEGWGRLDLSPLALVERGQAIEDQPVG